MRASIVIIINAIFGSAVLALPIITGPPLESLPDIAVPGIPSGKVGLTDGIVTTVEDTLSTVTGDIVRRIDLGEAGDLVSEIESEIDPILAEITSAAKTDSILPRFDLGVASDVLNDVESTASPILTEAFSLDKTGVVDDVRSTVGTVVSEGQDIVDPVLDEVASLDQTGTLSDAVNTIVRRIDLGAVGEVVSEVESVVDPVLAELTSLTKDRILPS